ncbi:MAG: transposase [Clostridia bacterium]|nr:transposase [Deltaproteobacteria bacterium]
MAKTGCPWRDLPERFGPWKTVHNRFTRWNQRGVLWRILDDFKKHADHESTIADGSKAHQDAAPPKLVTQAQGQNVISDNAYDADAVIQALRLLPRPTAVGI